MNLHSKLQNTGAGSSSSSSFNDDRSSCNSNSSSSSLSSMESNSRKRTFYGSNNNPNQLLPASSESPGRFEITRGAGINGSGNLPKPPGKVLNLSQLLKVHMDIIGATSIGPKECDRLQPTIVNTLNQHMIRFGTKTEREPLIGKLGINVLELYADQFYSGTF